MAALPAAALAIGPVLAQHRRPVDEGRLVHRRWLAGRIGGEVAGIAASLLLGAVTGRGDLVLPLIGTAVGLHLLPMARGSQAPTACG